MCKWLTVQPVCPTCLRFRATRLYIEDALITDPHPINPCDRAIRFQRFCHPRGNEDQLENTTLNIIGSVQCQLCINQNAGDILDNITDEEMVAGGIDPDLEYQRENTREEPPELDVVADSGCQKALMSVVWRAVQDKVLQIENGDAHKIVPDYAAKIAKPDPEGVEANGYLDRLYAKPLLQPSNIIVEPSSPVGEEKARLQRWVNDDELNPATVTLAERILVNVWDHPNFRVARLDTLSVTAACLYIACRKTRQRRSYNEIKSLTECSQVALKKAVGLIDVFVSKDKLTEFVPMPLWDVVDRNKVTPKRREEERMVIPDHPEVIEIPSSGENSPEFVVGVEPEAPFPTRDIRRPHRNGGRRRVTVDVNGSPQAEARNTPIRNTNPPQTAGEASKDDEVRSENSNKENEEPKEVDVHATTRAIAQTLGDDDAYEEDQQDENGQDESDEEVSGRESSSENTTSDDDDSEGDGRNDDDDDNEDDDNNDGNGPSAGDQGDASKNVGDDDDSDYSQGQSQRPAWIRNRGDPPPHQLPPRGNTSKRGRGGKAAQNVQRRGIGLQFSPSKASSRASGEKVAFKQWPQRTAPIRGYTTKDKRPAKRRKVRQSTCPDLPAYLVKPWATIDLWAKNLDVPPTISEQAKDFSRSLYETNWCKNKHKDTAIAACLFVACKVNGLDTELSGIQKATGVSTKMLYSLCEQLDRVLVTEKSMVMIDLDRNLIYEKWATRYERQVALSIHPIDMTQEQAWSLFYAWALRDGMNYDIASKAKTHYQNLKEANLIHCLDQNTTVLATCLRLAVLNTDFQRTPAVISDLTGVSVKALKLYVKNLHMRVEKPQRSRSPEGMRMSPHGWKLVHNWAAGCGISEKSRSLATYIWFQLCRKRIIAEPRLGYWVVAAACLVYVNNAEGTATSVDKTKARLGQVTQGREEEIELVTKQIDKAVRRGDLGRQLQKFAQKGLFDDVETLVSVSGPMTTPERQEPSAAKPPTPSLMATVFGENTRITRGKKREYDQIVATKQETAESNVNTKKQKQQRTTSKTKNAEVMKDGSRKQGLAPPKGKGTALNGLKRPAIGYGEVGYYLPGGCEYPRESFLYEIDSESDDYPELPSPGLDVKLMYG